MYQSEASTESPIWRSLLRRASEKIKLRRRLKVLLKADGALVPMPPTRTSSTATCAASETMYQIA